MANELTNVLRKAVAEILEKFPVVKEEIDAREEVDVFSLIEAILSKGVSLETLLAEAAVIAARESQDGARRDYRNAISFQISRRPPVELTYTPNSSVTWGLDPEKIRECVEDANDAVELFHDLSSLYGVELFQILGLRNLSSFVGEIFARQVRLSEPERLVSNPNQDGYPDLCALTPEGRRYIEKHRRGDGSIPSNKELWSPYPFGGVEVKATCGNTPAASKVPKPVIGESRLPILQSAEWKAHHQQTRILLGVFWDFVDGLPTIIAVFFRNDLDITLGANNVDWGAVIRPKDEGGRTTSVSIMKRPGVRKMGQGWLVLPREERYLERIRRIFGIALAS